MTVTLPDSTTKQGVLRRLQGICAAQGLPDRSADLGAISGFVSGDLEVVESMLNDRLAGNARADRVTHSARHLMALPGKRLRPLCVLLAARLGGGGGNNTYRLATAVELVHSATLLHDDVVDLGTVRRGQPAARTIYGNAACVFAGDWLLVEALRLVRAAELPAALDLLLSVIEEMISAEALQLEARGSIVADEATYFEIIRGKTASLFRWALFAGALAGRLQTEQARTLGRYGEHLGVAFQLVDDALDLAGDARATGKALFSDLREGKMTYPLIVGLERDPGLAHLLEQAIGEGAVDPEVTARVVASLEEHGACSATLVRAKQHAEQAVAELSGLPKNGARDLLEVVAAATTERRK